MAFLNLRKFGDPTLRQRSQSIKRINQEIKDLARDLAETMHQAPGVGLAAPQVGILKKVIVVSKEKKEQSEGKQEWEAYANPKILSYEGEKIEEEEGCLNLPKVQILVKRPNRINFKALDIKRGKEVSFVAEGWLARVLQHEVDHLEGTLIIDRASSEERKKALKELLSLSF